MLAKGWNTGNVFLLSTSKLPVALSFCMLISFFADILSLFRGLKFADICL